MSDAKFIEHFKAGKSMGVITQDTEQHREITLNAVKDINSHYNRKDAVTFKEVTFKNIREVKSLQLTAKLKSMGY